MLGASGVAPPALRSRRAWRPLALVLVRLTGRRGIGRHRRLWRRWRRCCGGWCRRRRTHGCRGRRRRGRSMGWRRGRWRRARRRCCCGRRRRYGLGGAAQRGGAGRGGGGGGAGGVRPGGRARRCGSGRCRARFGRGAFRWGSLRRRLGFSIGTKLGIRLSLRHHQRCGLRVRWRACELHRRQSRRGKQHETKVGHDDVNPRKGSEQ